MYKELLSFNERPKPFSVYTVDTLWTDPHLSQRMLDCHLNADVDLASRKLSSIESTIGWLNRRFDLTNKAVCDLGCGPGLYSMRLAQSGARVSGLDFSARSIDHANEVATREGLDLSFIQADYLKDELPADQDLMFLIYGDLCALSPERRRHLYAKIKAALKPGGHFVFDLFPTAQFDQLQEGAKYASRLMDGFWSPGNYFGFQTTFLYPELCLALDRYLILEEDRTREFFNWLQYFDPEGIREELTASGFEVVQVVDVLNGEPWNSSAQEFAVIAKNNS